MPEPNHDLRDGLIYVAVLVASCVVILSSVAWLLTKVVKHAWEG